MQIKSALTAAMTILLATAGCDDEDRRLIQQLYYCDDNQPCADGLTCDSHECVDPDDQCSIHPGSLGCECPDDECMENLTCMSGYCGPCPDEQLGCACGPMGTCEDGLMCTSENLCL